MATITNVMWLVEEYVMSNFKCIWCRQRELVIIIPHRESIKGGAMKFVRKLNIIVIPNKP